MKNPRSTLVERGFLFFGGLIFIVPQAIPLSRDQLLLLRANALLPNLAILQASVPLGRIKLQHFLFNHNAI
jgi:hypothetical protein